MERLLDEQLLWILTALHSMPDVCRCRWPSLETLNLVLRGLLRILFPNQLRVHKIDSTFRWKDLRSTDDAAAFNSNYIPFQWEAEPLMECPDLQTLSHVVDSTTQSFIGSNSYLSGIAMHTPQWAFVASGKQVGGLRLLACSIIIMVSTPVSSRHSEELTYLIVGVLFLICSIHTGAE